MGRLPVVLAASEVMEVVMSERTCVACDSPLEGTVVQVRIGGRTFEVCCEDCAFRLNEAAAVAGDEA
jgi:hypothetical protein